MAHSFRRSVYLTLFLLLVACAAWAPRVTLRDVLSSGERTGRNVVAAAGPAAVSVDAPATSRPWTAQCEGMRQRLRDPDIEIERKRAMALTFRNTCL